MINWIRRAGVPALAAIAVVLSGCDLEVLNPGAIRDADLSDPALMPILVNGVSSEYNDFQDDLAFDNAILSDDMSGTGSYSTTQLWRTGFFDNRDSEDDWVQTHESRWSAEQALERMQDVLGSDYGSSDDVAKAWMLKGFAEVRLGENFCYAVYNVGPAENRSASFDSAITAFNQAISIGNAAGTDDGDEIALAAYAGIAQAELGRASFGGGSWAAASAAAQDFFDNGGTVDFVDYAKYNTNADQNILWNETWGRAEYGVYNTLAQRLADAGDTRTPYVKCGEWDDDPPVLGQVTATGDCGGGDGSSGAHQGADGLHAHYRQDKYTERGSDIPRASGAEMKLIQAEAAIMGGAPDFTTFIDRINEARANYGLAALAAPTAMGSFTFPVDETNTTDALQILDRERYATLWFEGRRFFDLSRWDHPFLAGGPAVGDLIVGGFSETPRASCMPIPQSECLLNENLADSPACST